MVFVFEGFLSCRFFMFLLKFLSVFAVRLVLGARVSGYAILFLGIFCDISGFYLLDAGSCIWVVWVFVEFAVMLLFLEFFLGGEARGGFRRLLKKFDLLSFMFGI